MTKDWIAHGIADAWGWQHVRLRPIDVPSQSPRDLAAVVDVDRHHRAVVRVLAPGRVSVTAVESEIAWMTALGEDGVVRVPSVLRTPAGTAVGVLEGPHCTRWAAVALAYDPALVRPATPVDDAAGVADLGAIAARLHEHARLWQAPAWFRRPTVELTELVGPTSTTDWESVPMTETARRLLGTAQEEALDTISWAGPAPGLVHGHLRDAMEGGLLRSVESRWTWWEQDLAGSLDGLEDRVDAPTLAKAWLDAYRGELDLGLAGSLVMLRRLSSLTPDSLDGTLDVATRYLRSATWLTD